MYHGDRSVPFGEVPGNNIGIKCIQVIQVNIFRSLMLAPLPHTFMKERQDTALREYFHFSSLVRVNAEQPDAEQKLTQGRN